MPPSQPQDENNPSTLPLRQRWVSAQTAGKTPWSWAAGTPLLCPGMPQCHSKQCQHLLATGTCLQLGKPRGRFPLHTTGWPFEKKHSVLCSKLDHNSATTTLERSEVHWGLPGFWDSGKLSWASIKLRGLTTVNTAVRQTDPNQFYICALFREVTQSVK